MKKCLVFAAAALVALASCTKVEDAAYVADQQINFQTANYLSTKAASYKNGDFGVSAWYKGTDATNDADFMTYQQVTGNNGTNNLWTTVGKTYYWPKTGAIDFIAYSPFEVQPTLAEDAITYANMVVGDKDILYSDKVIGATAKNSGNGVPLLFRHALAQVKFIVKPSYDHKWEPSTGTYTSWTIDLGTTDFEISNIVNTGSLALTLDTDNSWKKPANSIWTPDATADKISLKYVSPGEITSESYDATKPLAVKTGTPAYILPQSTSSKTVTFTVSIETFRGTGATEAEAKAAAVSVLKETNVPVTATIADDLHYYWPMNTITTYTLRIAPSYSGKIYIPVYVKDADGDGDPDLDEDGNPETTTNPDEALKDPEGDPTPAETPVYVKDEDHDGIPDDEDGDGKPDTTTDPDDALNGPDNPTPAVDENGDPITEPIFEEKDAEGPVEIKFDPSVAPWEEATGTMVEVTK